MGKEYKINKLTYVPRQSGGANGYITIAMIWYVKKAESDDWTQVVTDGVWASDTKEKTAKFNTVDARYIKFVAKEGSNGFATASEFHIHQVLNEEEQEVTKAQEALNEAVNDSSIKGIYEAGEMQMERIQVQAGQRSRKHTKQQKHHLKEQVQKN